MATSINRTDYAAMFGPTVGDKIRLADTDLIVEVERDLTAERTNGGNGTTYGEEVLERSCRELELPNNRH